MNDVQELQRRASPAPDPQSLAWDGTNLWMGSRQTRRIYAINPATWEVSWETAAPGTPWSMIFVGGELRVLCGETAKDIRYIRRCVPGQRFDEDFGIHCPNNEGLSLGDGQRLRINHWYHPWEVLSNFAVGLTKRDILVPHGICGQVFVDDLIYLVTTDAGETSDYWLTRVDLRSATPKIDDLARIPFAARALAFDGSNFWTTHGMRNEIMSFAPPG